MLMKLFVTDNFKKYKIKHTLRFNILVVLKYKTNKELFKMNRKAKSVEKLGVHQPV